MKTSPSKITQQINRQPFGNISNIRASQSPHAPSSRCLDNPLLAKYA